MKRQQHKIELKRKVLNVSRKLFLENGYTRTTISEITKSVGITTGSLYHFFNGKEDILLHLTREVFDAAATFSDAMAGPSAEPWLRFSLEIGIQLYLVQKYPQVAELYLAAHQSADIARSLVLSAQDRNHKLLRSRCPDATPHDDYAVALAVKGIFHSFVQEAVHNREKVSLSVIFRAIEMALVIFHISTEEIEKTLRETHAMIQKCAFSIYGFQVP